MSYDATLVKTIEDFLLHGFDKGERTDGVITSKHDEAIDLLKALDSAGFEVRRKDDGTEAIGEQA